MTTRDTLERLAKEFDLKANNCAKARCLPTINGMIADAEMRTWRKAAARLRAEAEGKEE